MLYDKARIFVQGGAGGNGCQSFRREAHVPRGGPDGGDGGHGGAVVLLCDDSLRDLQSFKRKAHYKAPRGSHGQGALRHGAAGDDLVVRVPPGTTVTMPDGAVYDLVAPGQRVVVARGGGGGRGNKHFATPTRQAPRFAERGLEGFEGWIELRLRLLADVGLVGLPNAGKSSLLGRMTRAAPKIGNYPFTTLEPVLGTLDGPERQLVLADIPGLIEGASEGLGLGHDFLAHVERTRLLVHVLDLAPLDGSDPVANWETIENELRSYDARLADLPRIVALSKADLVTPDEAAAAQRAWEERVGADAPVLVTSAATGQGLEELSLELLRRVPAAPPVPALELPDEEALAEHRVFRPAADRGFSVERVGDGSFRVSGNRVERLLARFDVENEEAAAHVEHRLNRMGVIAALEAEGFEPGDDVEIAGQVFELDPGHSHRMHGFDEARLERADRHLARYVDDGRLAGWDLLVSRHGDVVHRSTHGSRDREAGLPVEDDTIWRIFSMTKPVTSIAAMMLYEEGAFELTDPVSRFIPSFADVRVFTGGSAQRPLTGPATEPVRIWHLLTHTAGLTYGFHYAHPVDALYRDAGFEWGQPPGMDLEACCDAWASLPLLFQPGAEWNYSVATDVLGRVVEVCSGQTLDAFFAERIFGPLGMRDTAFFADESRAGRLAALYVPDPATRRAVPSPVGAAALHRPACLSGGGGLVSTMADYHRFTQMLLNEGELEGVRLLGSRTLRYMRQNHLPGGVDLETFGRPLFAETTFNGIGFGLGVSVVMDPVANHVPSSAGEFAWGGAASTLFWVDPVERITAIFMTQLLPSSTHPLRSQVRQLVMQALVD